MTVSAATSSTPAPPPWVAAVLADLAAGDPACVAETRVRAFDELEAVDVGPGGGKVQAASGISPSGEAGSRQSERFLYAGQYRDAESGLYYLRARYYDPSTAQFLTADPLASRTKERYGYANDNPLNATDPSGLCSWNPFDSNSCEIAAPARAISAAADAAAPVVSKVASGLSAVASGAAVVCSIVAAPTLVAGESVCGGIETFSLATGGIATAADAYLAARGKGSAGTVVLDVLGLGAGGLGKFGGDFLPEGLDNFLKPYAFGFSAFAFASSFFDDPASAYYQGSQCR